MVCFLLARLFYGEVRQNACTYRGAQYFRHSFGHILHCAVVGYTCRGSPCHQITRLVESTPPVLTGVDSSLTFPHCLFISNSS